MRTARYSWPLILAGIALPAVWILNSTAGAPKRGYPVISSLSCQSKTAAAKAPAVPLREARMLSADGGALQQGCWYAGAGVGMQTAIVLFWEDGSTESYPFAVFAYYGFRYDEQLHRFVPNYNTGP